MHFSIRINAQPNYGYGANYGGGYGASYGYPQNAYPERAYYPSGPVDPEQAMAQNLGQRLAYGDAQGAANLLRSELYSNPRDAMRLVNDANRDAGQRARDRIISMDGSLAIQDIYTGATVPVNGRSAYAGFPPPGQVQGYYANQNNNYYNGAFNPNSGVYNPNAAIGNPTLAAWNYAPQTPQISFAIGLNRAGYGGNYAGYYSPYYRHQPRAGISIMV
jgi:hypothetical protein